MPLDLSRDVAIRWSDPDPKHVPLLKECGANTVILEAPSSTFTAVCRGAEGTAEIAFVKVAAGKNAPD